MLVIKKIVFFLFWLAFLTACTSKTSSQGSLLVCHVYAIAPVEQNGDLLEKRFLDVLIDKEYQENLEESFKKSNKKSKKKIERIEKELQEISNKIESLKKEASSFPPYYSEIKELEKSLQQKNKDKEKYEKVLAPKEPQFKMVGKYQFPFGENIFFDFNGRLLQLPDGNLEQAIPIQINVSDVKLMGQEKNYSPVKELTVVVGDQKQHYFFYADKVPLFEALSYDNKAKPSRNRGSIKEPSLSFLVEITSQKGPSI